MMQTIKRISLWIFTILLIVTISLTLLVTTAPGLRMCLYFVNFWVPQLTIQNLSGNLFSLHAQDVQYEDESIIFSAKHVNYTFDPSLITERIIDLTSANAQAIQIQFRSKNIAKENSSLFIKELSGVGVLNFQEALKWDARLQTLALSSQTLLPDASFSVTGQLQVIGQKQGQNWFVRLNDLSYQGLLNQVKLHLNGTAQVDSEGWIQAQGLELKAGASRLFFDGRVNPNKSIPRVALNADIHLPNLSELVPTLNGVLNGKVVMHGGEERPVITFDVLLEKFSGMAVRLHEAKLQGHVTDPTNITGQATLKLQGFATEGMTLQQARMSIDGTEKNHQIFLTSKGEPLSVETQFRGNFDRNNHVWVLNWPKAELSIQGQKLRLKSPTSVSLQTQKKILDLQSQCWQHKSTRLCLPEATKIYLTGEKAFPVHLTLEDLNLQMLNRYLQAPVHLNGTVSGQAMVEVPEGFQGLPQAKLNLNSNNSSLLYTLSDSDKPISFDRLNLEAQLQKELINIKVKVALEKNAEAVLEATVQDPLKRRQLSGKLSVEAMSMAWLESFLPPGEKVVGNFTSDLSFAGELLNPQLFGSIQLDQFRVDSVTFPFEMKPSHLTIDFDGQRSNLNGKLLTQKGDMTLAGQAQWSGINDVRAKLNLSTDRLRMMVPPTSVLDIATNVSCELSPQLLKLDGVIRVPWARIQVKQLPEQAIKVSDDVVRLDQPQPLIKPASVMAVQSNLFIEIGDDVKVDAMGLKADLTGRLHVVQDNGRLGLNGQILVPDGQYKAYGQSLDVRKGVVSFAGAIKNPQLDIEAIRSPEKTADNVTVGIRVTGSARAPKVAVFSDPAMSEGEALSYLLSGEGLNANRENDAMIASALLGLGTTQSAQLLSAIGDAVGIEDLQLDTEGVGDTSQLIVSGYVLPGLKVKYGVGLFDSLSTLTLRYQIIPKLYLEVVSGVDQALDVLYQFEFN